MSTLIQALLPGRVSLEYNSKKHIPQLDGIRGLAVFLVVLFHCFPFLIVSSLGWLGVDLFFVLSGFLITGILFDTKNHPHYYRNFVMRRVLRIFPLYYVVLALYFFVLPHILPETEHTATMGFLKNQAWYWGYVSNWNFVFNHEELALMNEAFAAKYQKSTEVKYWIDGLDINHFWSLAIEEQFYIFWPIVVFLFNRKGIIVTTLIIIFLSIGARVYFTNSELPPISTYVSTITRFDGLAIGALIALAIRSDKGKALIARVTKPTLILTGLSILGLVFIAKSTSPYSREMQLIGYTASALFFASIMVLALSNHHYALVRKLTSGQFFRFLGKYSYALYVFHLPLFHGLNPILCKNFRSFIGNEFILQLISSCIIMLLTVGLSLITWNFLEKPFTNLKRYFAYK